MGIRSLATTVLAHRTFALAGLALLISVSAACTESSAVQCGDVFCPATSTCVSPERGCFPTEQVDACVGAADGDACTVADIAGTCREGLCVNQSCGDGVIDDGTEVCDDGNVFDGDSCSSDCQTASCLVPISHATVQELLDDADCPTAHLTPGRYNEQLTINRDVDIVRAGEGVVTIDGGGEGRTLTVPAGVRARIADIEITGGNSDQCGGGVHNSGDLIVENVRVINNQATSGGGICHVDGTLVSLGLEIDGNEARTDTDIARGGGLLATAILVVSGRTRVTNNISNGEGASAHGGGVYIESTTAAFSGDCEMSGNQSASSAFGGVTYGGAFGGAGYAAGASLTLSGCAIVDNTSDGPGLEAGGGGFLIQGGTTSLTGGSRFEGNTVTGKTAFGGGLYLSGVQATAEDLTVVDNAANGEEANGGGVFVITSPAAVNVPFVLTGATISGNAALATGAARGGGLMLSEHSTVVLTQLTVASNRAEGTSGGGGGVSVRSVAPATANIHIRSSTFSDNLTTAGGGGLHVEGSRTALNVRLVNNTLSGNAADTGAALLAASSATTNLVRLFSTTVTLNVASGTGGGVRVVETGGGIDLVLEGSIVAGNSAPTDPDCSTSGTASLSTNFNIIGDTQGCVLSVGGSNQVGVDPMLAPLADNGGPTLTHRPMVGSPAIDQGNTGGCIDPTQLRTDQRGLERPIGICDVGAVELQ